MIVKPLTKQQENQSGKLHTLLKWFLGPLAEQNGTNEKPIENRLKINREYLKSVLANLLHSQSPPDQASLTELQGTENQGIQEKEEQPTIENSSSQELLNQFLSLKDQAETYNQYLKQEMNKLKAKYEQCANSNSETESFAKFYADAMMKALFQNK